MAEACSAILAGNMLLGFAVAAFILPSGVIMGGATGVGIVLGKVIPLDTAEIVLGVNLMALALGWAVLGWRFVLATIASSLLYPFFLGAAQRIPGIDRLTADPLPGCSRCSTLSWPMSPKPSMTTNPPVQHVPSQNS